MSKSRIGAGMPTGRSDGPMNPPRTHAERKAAFSNAREESLSMWGAVGKAPPTTSSPRPVEDVKPARPALSPERMLPETDQERAAADMIAALQRGETPPKPAQPRQQARVNPEDVQRPTRPAPARPPAEVREEFTARDAQGNPLDSRWERVSLPSQFAFYDFGDAHVRRLTVEDQVKIARAVRHKNLTVLLDALAATCTRDPREFCLPDFEMLCLWHKFNSYLDAPMVVSWTTRYGNRTTVTSLTQVREDKRPFPASIAEAHEAMAKGFTLSTARDMELLAEMGEGDPLANEDSLYVFERAQFLIPDPELVEAARERKSRTPTMDARIEQLLAIKDVNVLGEIDAFAERFANFGVDEYCYVRDVKFDPFEFARKELPSNAPADLVEEQRVCREWVELPMEERELENRPAAKEEEVRLPFEVWSCFRYA